MPINIYPWSSLFSKKPDPKKTPLISLQMPKKLYFNIDCEIKRYRAYQAKP